MLKGQDILVALTILDLSEWQYATLARALGIGTSEVGLCLQRLQKAKIYRQLEREINQTNLLEVLVHGMKYFFAASLGPSTRGIPTAWGYKKIFGVVKGMENPVWPSKDGIAYGPSVTPIYKTVPFAAESSPRLYAFLAAIDALRVGGKEKAS